MAQRPIHVDAYTLRDDGRMPNNDRLPLLIYRGAVRPAAGDPASTFETLFAGNNWKNSWRNGIYNYHHFHATTHEVLGIARGQASVRFGGENGVLVDIRAGDVVVIPAGVGHRKEDASNDLLVVGAYPGTDHEPDICTGTNFEREKAAKSVPQVAIPKSDPVFGRDGPLTQRWRIEKSGR